MLPPIGFFYLNQDGAIYLPFRFSPCADDEAVRGGPWCLLFESAVNHQAELLPDDGIRSGAYFGFNFLFLSIIDKNSQGNRVKLFIILPFVRNTVGREDFAAFDSLTDPDDRVGARDYVVFVCSGQYE